MKQKILIIAVIVLSIVALRGFIPIHVSMGTPSAGAITSQAQPSSDKVWVTDSGSAYHTANCKWLANSTTKHEVSLSEAKSEGLTPCPTCEVGQ